MKTKASRKGRRSGGKVRLEQHGAAPRGEPPSAAPAQAAHAADDRGDEGDEHRREAHRAASASRSARRRAGARRPRRAGREIPNAMAITRFAAHAEHPRHAEVLRGGAHLHADRRAAAGTPVSPTQQHGRRRRSSTRSSLAIAQPGDDDRVVETGSDVDRLRARADAEQHEVLQQVADARTTVTSIVAGSRARGRAETRCAP